MLLKVTDTFLAVKNLLGRWDGEKRARLPPHKAEKDNRVTWYYRLEKDIWTMDPE